MSLVMAHYMMLVVKDRRLVRFYVVGIAIGGEFNAWRNVGSSRNQGWS